MYIQVIMRENSLRFLRVNPQGSEPPSGMAAGNIDLVSPGKDVLPRFCHRGVPKLTAVSWTCLLWRSSE